MSLKKIFDREYKKAAKPVDAFDIGVVEDIKALIAEINADPDFEAVLEKDHIGQDSFMLSIAMKDGYKSTIRLSYIVEERNGRMVPKVGVGMFLWDKEKLRDISLPEGRAEVIGSIVTELAQDKAEAVRKKAKQELIRQLF